VIIPVRIGHAESTDLPAKKVAPVFRDLCAGRRASSPSPLEGIGASAKAEVRIDNMATRLIEATRQGAGPNGGLEDLLRDCGLSTNKGLALMVLAEALLRISDAAARDKLIEDKIGEGCWEERNTQADT